MPRMTISRSSVWLSLAVLATVVGPMATAVAQAAARPTTYTVKRGDTLMSIAREVYGDATRWKDIFDLNSDKLSDPSHIVPGQVLKLAPAALAEARPTPEAKAPAVPAAQKPVEKPAEQLPEMTRPHQEPERPPVVISEPVQEPSAAQQGDSLFVRRRGVDAYSALRTYREQPYRPLRRGEFYSSGFLTEGEALPFGHLLGAVTPQQIRNLSERATVTLYTTVAVAPPAGASYQVGDSLLLVLRAEGPPGYGEVVIPTGMARVTGQSDGQATAIVVAVYGAIRNGQFALPAEKFAGAGTSRAQPVTGGVSGHFLMQREVRELKHPQNVLFLDVGRRDGVAPGDLFEIRRDPEARQGTADTIDELMGLVQVVHVRERSATVRVLNVTSPDIPPGTRVVQVAKLP